MAEIGKLGRLSVLRNTSHGVFLDGGVLGDILLPKRSVPAGVEVGQILEAFIYRDSEDRVVATLDTPKVQAGEFSLLIVTQVNQIGAFVDIGLSKDLLVPFAQQHKPMEVERAYLVYCYLNQQDQRLVGSSKIDQFLDENSNGSLLAGQEVHCIVGPTTPLGVKVIINHQFWGLIHQDQVFRNLKFGQKLVAVVQSIRHDGKINVALNSGHKAMDGDAEVILRVLRKAQGRLSITERASPLEIKNTFGMSKAAFKRAIGQLYKAKKIRLENGIELISETDL